MANGSFLPPLGEKLPSTLTRTAIDITVSELSIESFFPADAATAQLLRAAAAAA